MHAPLNWPRFPGCCCRAASSRFPATSSSGSRHTHHSTLCWQVAFNPKVLLPLSHIGEQDEFRVQDASSFCALDERLSYWELLVRHLYCNAGRGFGTRTVQRDRTIHSMACGSEWTPYKAAGLTVLPMGGALHWTCDIHLNRI
jgi:hypothetical protein